MKSKICILITLILLTTFAFAIDNSGANAPEVYQGLYPIKYNQSGGVIYTSTSDSDWYNYSEGRWANAVTLDKQGQMNPSAATVDNITGYYVWIPRYAYLIRTGYNSSNTGRIDIRFLDGTTNADKNGNTYYTINDLDNEAEKWEVMNTVTYMGDRQMEYLVHPAFNFEEELTGIWVGKYQAKVSEKADFNRDGIVDSKDVDLLSASLNSDNLIYDIDGDGYVNSWDLIGMSSFSGNISEVLTTGEVHQNVTVDNAFEVIRDMSSTSENYDKYNSYGLEEGVNTHLIKPTEYGAVAYLSDSIYAEDNCYKVYGLENKEYMAGGLDGSIDTGIDKYVDIYEKDESDKIVDIKGSVYLETSDGMNAWNSQTITNINETNGVMVKEGTYGVVARNGQDTDVGFRVALTKGTNKNEIKKSCVLKDDIEGVSYYWLMENGDLWVMGNDKKGQIGIADYFYINMPIKLEKDAYGDDIPAIRDITVDSGSVWYVAENGDVYVSGNNTQSRLGLGSDEQYIYKATPISLSLDDGEKVERVVCNGYTTYFMINKGTVYACGMNDYGIGVNSTDATVTLPLQVIFPTGEKVKDIVGTGDVSHNATWFFMESDKIYGAGLNANGKLGVGSDDNAIYQPLELQLTLEEGEKVVEVVEMTGTLSKRVFGIYLTNKGRALASGRNTSGQLGIGSTGNIKIPQEVKLPLLDGEKIDRIIYDSQDGMYLTNLGNVYVCGVNGEWQLGVEESNISTPKKVQFPVDEKVKAIFTDAENYNNSYAKMTWFLTESKKVYGSGYSNPNRLGVDYLGNIGVPREVPLTLEEGEEVIDVVFTSSNCTFYLTNYGKAFACGLNYGGELGVAAEDFEMVITPKRVIMPAGEKIKQIIHVPESDTWFLCESGNVYACGWDDYMLGIGDGFEHPSIPQRVLIPVGEKVKEVLPDDTNTWFLTESGKIYVCGDTWSYSLGVTDSNVFTPIEITGVQAAQIPFEKKYDVEIDENIYLNERIVDMSNQQFKKIREVITDGSTTRYITEDGELYAAGYNEEGYVGVGSSELSVYSAMKVLPSEEKLKEVITDESGMNIWYITESGKVYACGYNSLGQLGIMEGVVNKATLVLPAEERLKKLVLDENKVAYYITESGKVYASGSNAYGRLGVGGSEETIINKATQVTIPETEKVIDIVIENKTVTVYDPYKAYFLCESGKVYAAGQNSNGELGVDSDDEKIYSATEIPLTLLPEEKVIEIRAYSMNAYYLTNKGRVFVSGYNSYGELGVGSSESKVKKATLVPIPEGEKVKEMILNGISNSFYITESGKIYACGSNTDGKLGVGSEDENVNIVTEASLPNGEEAERLIINSDFVCCITKSGNMYACGDNSGGKLGVGSGDAYIDSFMPALLLSGDKVKQVESPWCITENGMLYKCEGNSFIQKTVPNGDRIKEIKVSGGSYWFIAYSGRVYATGANTGGRLGIGIAGNQTEIFAVTIPDGEKVKEITTTMTSASFLTESDKLYVAGRNTNGAIGANTGTSATCVLPTEEKIKEMITHNKGVWYLTESGKVYVHGSNENGQLGAGEDANILLATQINFPNNQVIKKISAGDDAYAAFYITENGRVYATGDNSNGKLGVESDESIIYEVEEVLLPQNAKVENVIAQFWNTWYITEDKKVYAAGDNTWGEMGIGINGTRNVPVRILIHEDDDTYANLGNITSIYGNATSTIFEQENGDIYVVGDNTSGKLGIAGNIQKATKINLKNVKDAGVGNDFSVFLKDDGSVVGYGNSSKNGNGLTNIAQIAVGDNHSVFLTKSGQIIANGSTLEGVNDAYKVVAGANHTVILKKNGTTKSFGQAESGLTNVVDIFAGENMTVFITKDNKTYLMEDDTLTQLPIKDIVYADLNGDTPYFVNLDRDLIDKNGRNIEVLNTKLQWVKEVKGNIVLTERMRVYDLSRL